MGWCRKENWCLCKEGTVMAIATSTIIAGASIVSAGVAGYCAYQG